MPIKIKDDTYKLLKLLKRRLWEKSIDDVIIHLLINGHDCKNECRNAARTRIMKEIESLQAELTEAELDTTQEETNMSWELKTRQTIRKPRERKPFKSLDYELAKQQICGLFTKEDKAGALACLKWLKEQTSAVAEDSEIIKVDRVNRFLRDVNNC